MKRRRVITWPVRPIPVLVFSLYPFWCSLFFYYHNHTFHFSPSEYLHHWCDMSLLLGSRLTNFASPLTTAKYSVVIFIHGNLYFHLASSSVFDLLVWEIVLVLFQLLAIIQVIHSLLYILKYSIPVWMVYGGSIGRWLFKWNTSFSAKNGFISQHHTLPNFLFSNHFFETGNRK